MNHWISKFRNAIRGVAFGMDGQSSFLAHIPIAFAVLAAAWWLECNYWQWCVLVLCIAQVLALELMNSAIEFLAKGLCNEHNENVGKALDIASGAVLVGSIFAALIGVFILAGKLYLSFQ